MLGSVVAPIPGHTLEKRDQHLCAGRVSFLFTYFVGSPPLMKVYMSSVTAWMLSSPR